MLKHEFAGLVSSYIVPQGAEVPADGLPHVQGYTEANLLIHGLTSAVDSSLQRQVAVFAVETPITPRRTEQRVHVLCSDTRPGRSLVNNSYERRDMRVDPHGLHIDFLPDAELFVSTGRRKSRLGDFFIDPVDCGTNQLLVARTGRLTGPHAALGRLGIARRAA